MKYEAILFDLDGTLIDSIPLWMQAYQQTLTNFGVDISKEEFIQNVYLAHKDLGEVLEEYGVNENENVIRTMRDVEYCALVSSSPLWYPEAEAAFDAIRSVYPVGIVTGSWGQYIQAEDKAIQLSKKVEVIITTDETQGRGKPDPYGILLACERMNVTPQNCIYIGDVKIDADAARSAGMTSFVVERSHTPKEAIEAADYTGNSLVDLLTYLELE